MRYLAVIVALCFALLMFAGCASQSGQATGASNLPDFSAYTARVNATGVAGSYELRAAYSRHIFTIWSTNATTLVNTSSFIVNATETCAITSALGGLAGAAADIYNETGLATANGSVTISGVTSPERNYTDDNLMVDHESSATENVSVYMNGFYLGRINQSDTQTNLSVASGYLTPGTNTVLFVNTGEDTNVTNVTLSYMNASFNCSHISMRDGQKVVLFETADLTGQLNISITNITINTSETFELDVFGGDLLVVKNTNSTYIGLYSNYGFCDPLGFEHPLAWNSTGWTNITGLSRSIYASLGTVKICTVRKETGNVSNYGAAIDYVRLTGNYSWNFTGGAVGNVTFQTSIDNVNWFTDATMSYVGSTPVRVQTNQTAFYARFNVTGLVLTAPSKDALYIQYIAVSN